MNNKTIRILGTRGIPANHGGFETFAEHLALYLVARGWDVTVYCQQDGTGAIHEDQWRGVRRVHIPVQREGAAGTIVFDWKATLHSAREPGLVLTLGYNTAVFSLWYRLKGLTNLFNMDGIEWRRQKWGALARTWFYLNEWAGAWLGNHLIADHPHIKQHLSSRVKPNKITTIAYGADAVTAAPPDALQQYGLTPGSYAILIARAEPENSILEVVQGWSRSRRGMKLVVLGKYDPQHAYQSAVRQVAGDEVQFIGAVYDAPTVQALRFHARLYVHGHQVGGTNPSLVEALGAGNPVLAHDNPYNRWVAGPQACYFSGAHGCADQLDRILPDTARLAAMQQASRDRHAEAFTWDHILRDYETLLLPHARSAVPHALKAGLDKE